MPVTIYPLQQLYGFIDRQDPERNWEEKLITLSEFNIFESVRATWRVMSEDTDAIPAHYPLILKQFYKWTFAQAPNEPPEPPPDTPRGDDSFGLVYTQFEDVETEAGVAKAGYQHMEIAYPRQIGRGLNATLWICQGVENLLTISDYEKWLRHIDYYVYYRISPG